MTNDTLLEKLLNICPDNFDVTITTYKTGFAVIRFTDDIDYNNMGFEKLFQYYPSPENNEEVFQKVRDMIERYLMHLKDFVQAAKTEALKVMIDEKIPDGWIYSATDEGILANIQFKQDMNIPLSHWEEWRLTRQK